MAKTADTVSEETGLKAGASYLNDLLPALQQLDNRLARAVVAARAAYGPNAESDPYRGLYINQDEVARLLARKPGSPALQMEQEDISINKAEPTADRGEQPADRQSGGLFSFIGHWLKDRKSASAAAQPPAGQPDAEATSRPDNHIKTDAPVTPLETAPFWPHPLGGDTQLGWLAQSFNLSPFDLDVILIALAPELDRRYERLYAFLQDNVSFRRSSVDLALNLLCPNAVAKLERRVHFAADAPLIQHNIIHLIPQPDQAQPLLLAQALKLDDQIVRLILGQQSLDTRLAPFCRVVEPTLFLDELSLNPAVKRALSTIAGQVEGLDQPLRLFFHGPPGTGKQRAAEAVAGEIGTILLVADLEQTLAPVADFKQRLSLLFREAWFHHAILYLEGLDALRTDEYETHYAQLLDLLGQDGGITILAGARPWVSAGRGPTGVITVSFPIPNFDQRREHWVANLAAIGLFLEDQDLDTLAGRFRLTPNQISESVATAYNQAHWRAAAQSNDKSTSEIYVLPTMNDFFAAARAQTGHDLDELARKVEPIFSWDDIVLPDDTRRQLQEICQRVGHRHRVLDEWGFDRKLSLGKGVNALFAGSSGTGKTMAAEIIAYELGLDLYKIDLSGVVSKYIGETEKNLDRIFSAAENANAILFFDEADALFGKRSEVRDSHDRYANIEISYLLQKMEEYEGIAILATNLRQNLDESFLRRLAFTVNFPFPDEDARLRIWQGIWPKEIDLDTDVDQVFLAREFKLSGGNIRNVALAAAFLAAAEDSAVVRADHLWQALRREYQKMGKELSKADLKGADFLAVKAA